MILYNTLQSGIGCNDLHKFLGNLIMKATERWEMRDHQDESEEGTRWTTVCMWKMSSVGQYEAKQAGTTIKTCLHHNRLGQPSSPTIEKDLPVQ